MKSIVLIFEIQNNNSIIQNVFLFKLIKSVTITPFFYTLL